MEPKIYAGALKIDRDSGTWIFLDIGFSNKKRTCGFLVKGGKPKLLLFNEAKGDIKSEILKSKLPVNLVIEAPLSVCFDKNGNPKGRKIEHQDGKVRYWYSGLGCAVMVAAIYLIHEIH